MRARRLHFAATIVERHTAIRKLTFPYAPGLLTFREGRTSRCLIVVKPVYVSVGHRMTLSVARQLVLDCGAAYRLPEPTRLADQLVARAKRG